MKKLSLAVVLFAVILAFSACKDSGQSGGGGGGGGTPASAMDKFIWTEYDSSAGALSTFSSDLIDQGSTKLLDAKLKLNPAGLAPNGDVFWTNAELGIFISNINEKDQAVRSLITTKKIFDDYLGGYKNSSNTIPSNYTYAFFQDPSDKNHYKAILTIADDSTTPRLIYDSADGSISKLNLPAIYSPINYGPNAERKIFDDAVMLYGVSSDGSLAGSVLYKPFANKFETFVVFDRDNFNECAWGFVYTDRSKIFCANIDDDNLLIEGSLYTPLGKYVTTTISEDAYPITISGELTKSKPEKLFSVSYKSISESDRKLFHGFIAENETNVFIEFSTQRGTVSIYKIDVASGKADKVAEYYEMVVEASSTSSPSVSTNAMLGDPVKSVNTQLNKDTLSSDSSGSGLTGGFGATYQKTSDDELLLINGVLIYSAKRNKTIDLRKSIESNGNYLFGLTKAIDGNFHTHWGTHYFSPDGKYLLCTGGRVVLLDQLFKDGEPTFINVLPKEDNIIEYKTYVWNGYEIWFARVDDTVGYKIYITKGFDPKTAKLLHSSSSIIGHRIDATVTNFVPTTTAGLDMSVPMTEHFACSKGGFYCADKAATCSNKACVATACETAATCPLGYDCAASGTAKVCTKKSDGSCYDSAQCPAGNSCKNNLCTWGDSCTTSCSGKECGDDGCGGTCGECGNGFTCNDVSKCEATCTPNCAGKTCGDDGCGGTCGTCTAEQICGTENKCIAAPECAADADCGSGNACVSSKCEATVNFPDANLKAAVIKAIKEEVYNNASSAPTDKVLLKDCKSEKFTKLTSSVMTQVQNQEGNISYTCSTDSASELKKIKSLGGIGSCTNIKELDLSCNAITAVNSLSALSNLTYLKLTGNNIGGYGSPVKPIGVLYNLNTLYINHNPLLKNIDGLATLKKLTFLALDHNGLTSISTVSGMKSLKTLHLWGNKLFDLSPIKDLKYLEYVDVGYNCIGRRDYIKQCVVHSDGKDPCGYTPLSAVNSGGSVTVGPFPDYCKDPSIATPLGSGEMSAEAKFCLGTTAQILLMKQRGITVEVDKTAPTPACLK